MKQKQIFYFLFIIIPLFFTITQTAWGTHLRAGEITVTRDNCASLTFTITVTVYTDTRSTVKFGGPVADNLDILDFGDGNRMVIPEVDNTLRPDLGDNIGVASFTIQHTYRGPGKYLISYREPNRNQGVLNMSNSVQTMFYIETEIIVDPFLGCNNTPKLLISPVDVGCIGVAFQHNPGAFDPDGDSLSYELVIPFRDINSVVAGYNNPNHPSFYTGNYNQANESQDGPPTFSIDPITGTLAWDAPGGVQGEYNIAFIIVEWRNINGQWVKLGFVRRDMQIIIEDCDNERPDLIIPNDTCVVAGTTLNATIFGIDPDNDQVKIEAFSELFGNTFVSPASVSPNPGIFAPSAPNPAELQFQWNTVCDHVKDQPYQVVFKITDKGRPKLVTFKTWFITVVGPAPEWSQISVNLAKRHAALEWNEYECQNASLIQVWRRVDSFQYIPDNCETGMPASLGYNLIAELPINTTKFTDTNGGRGLAVGAQYCYRLVASYPLPRGGESYISEEICIDPILADAPVITHVTVQKTDKTLGEIRVSWRNPFEIDPTQFPKPYKYKVWRSENRTGNTPWTEVHSGIIDDTTTVDDGINTLEKTYSYHVELYAIPNNTSTYSAIDTSAAASMVVLEIEAEEKKLNLSWDALVPWSNQTQPYPRHLIYRGIEGTPEGSLTLIDSVNVIQNGFIYSDAGKYNNTPLADDVVYCYKVMTRGTYGNPDVQEPLNNFSQMVCAQPSDDEPPTCSPVVTIQNLLSCEQYVANVNTCAPNTFANELRWNRLLEESCGGDIVGYRIYASLTTNGEFLPIPLPDNATFIRDTFFIDNNLASFAKCYKISAVDRSGNESELSEPVCNDNCPYYELPNVFTPNGDGCNDTFNAYREIITENHGEELSCPLVDKTKCARFVETVKFRVYNRWGMEVYTFESVQGSENKTIYIDWNGHDNNDSELATGVYFYVAEVTFDTIDKRAQTLKGWIHLVK